ncbi:MAG: hypothetical protein WCH98_07950 [Verrucomicrobiota bacterium]
MKKQLPWQFLETVLSWAMPLWLLAVGLVMMGCSGVETFDRKSTLEYVTVAPTDLFVHGPMQPGRAVELPPQEFVKLLSRDSGYSVVALEDGRSGWVDSRSLRPAPPSVRAVTEEEVFPEKAALFPPVPEPDLKLPDENVPKVVPPAKSPEKKP